MPDASVTGAEGSFVAVGPFAHDAAVTHSPKASNTYFLVIGNVSMRASTAGAFYQRDAANAPVVRALLPGGFELSEEGAI